MWVITETFILTNRAAVYAPQQRLWLRGAWREAICTLQGYLAHNEAHPPRTLQ